MKLSYRIYNAKTADAEIKKEAIRLNTIMFENEPNIGHNFFSDYLPSFWVFAYATIDKKEHLIGKSDVTLLKHNYSNTTMLRAKISNLCVLPYAAKKHVGTELLLHSINKCKKNNVNYVFLHVKKQSEPSAFNVQEFYIKNGFSIINIPKNNSNIETMVLPLTKIATHKNIITDLLNAQAHHNTKK